MQNRIPRIPIHPIITKVIPRQHLPKAVVGALAVVAAAAAWGISGVTVIQQAQASPCGISPAQTAFCETFNSPSNSGTRSGQLDGTIWGVSRTSGQVNIGQNMLNVWAPTQLVGCSGTSTVAAPNDVIVCNGQLREATNDNVSGNFEGGDVTTLAMYPKQPFDFAGRTGKVTFDVGNDAQGIHGAWPEFWITDKPVPAPFTHGSWESLPQFGFGIRFAGSTNGTGGGSGCAQGSSPAGKSYVGVDSANVVNNYVQNDSSNGGALRVVGLDCVKQPTQTGQLNHYEIDVSQSQIDVYGTDAGTTAPLKHLASIPNVNLGFTRGLVWLEDAHYNADKSAVINNVPSQSQHTFVWDNVGFDGPFTYHDLAFDALDANVPHGNGFNLGKVSGPNQSASWSVLGMPASPSAETVRVLFNFNHTDTPTKLDVSVNGHAHSVQWPYPDTQGYTWRTFAVTVPITDLVAGTNVVTIGADKAIVTSNVDIVLVNAGSGGVTPVPASPTPVRTAVPPTLTPRPAATGTAVVVATSTPAAQTCTIQAKLNGVDTTYTRPVSDCSDQ